MANSLASQLPLYLAARSKDRKRRNPKTWGTAHRPRAQDETEMKKYIEWLLSWFRDLPGEDGLAEYQCDDCHDSIDPQAVTRIYGNAIETGEWRK